MIMDTKKVLILFMLLIIYEFCQAQSSDFSTVYVEKFMVEDSNLYFTHVKVVDNKLYSNRTITYYNSTGEIKTTQSMSDVYVLTNEEVNQLEIKYAKTVEESEHYKYIKHSKIKYLYKADIYSRVPLDSKLSIVKVDGDFYIITLKPRLKNELTEDEITKRFELDRLIVGNFKPVYRLYQSKVYKYRRLYD